MATAEEAEAATAAGAAGLVRRSMVVAESLQSGRNLPNLTPKQAAACASIGKTQHCVYS